MLPYGEDDEKLLNEKNKEILKDFDYAREIVDTFFDNFDTYFDDDSYPSVCLATKVKGDTYGAFGTERKVENYLDAIRSAMYQWMEGEREELIVYLLDKQACEDEDNEV